ncbi:olfactory receptor 1020-like [Ochotona curzoniae]|uniref:olfactory receptor 1020-like n=1 Tax=Ochotona curzoniae TaxID=130825 RepID=UPI001B3523A7|nr:olfactory receptor 1020-like [Ochotona curzoniae]
MRGFLFFSFPGDVTAIRVTIEDYGQVSQITRYMKNHQGRNQTQVKEFILLGLTDNPDLQGLLFVLFLSIYLTTMLGNLGLIVLIKLDPRLHTPMYFLLSSLSFVDASYSSSVTPKMLVNLVAENKAISFRGCAAQFYFFGSFLGTECFLLAMMAYDRYAAIWNPLLYPVIMSERVCFLLVAASFLAGFGNAAIHTAMTFRLSFCDSNKINHFYCDTPPLLKLSCSDTYINGIVIMAFSSFDIFSCVTIVLISYLCILIAILKIPSTEGRFKAFSTCASHLMAVTIFFGTILFMYLRPTSSYSMEQDKIVSVFYAVVIPMLNPFIYSLKNKDVKDAFKKILNLDLWPSGYSPRFEDIPGKYTLRYTFAQTPKYVGECFYKQSLCCERRKLTVAEL